MAVLDEISKAFYPLSIYDKITLLFPQNIPNSNTLFFSLVPDSEGLFYQIIKGIKIFCHLFHTIKKHLLAKN